ncbi:Transposase [Suttonella ornithocola]|uniref:Transposase n=1 Tax=Suttonella ornithocola TaxID=279832 RepID=A0A380MLI1_9GAMM|nr:helix-turn-helix domain-containing protein [Suttonella ornithocola]SUO93031.1 Transposase [Suttonella ornithocola]SUO93499.1 Transposase [Suttonella ornithocola]SUO96906.1 Transposase [Suttonella ornithocola]
MTYCSQFRQKILNDIANGETWRAVAKRYKISKFTVYSWIKNPHPKGFTESPQRLMMKPCLRILSSILMITNGKELDVLIARNQRFVML